MNKKNKNYLKKRNKIVKKELLNKDQIKLIKKQIFKFKTKVLKIIMKVKRILVNKLIFSLKNKLIKLKDYKFRSEIQCIYSIHYFRIKMNDK